MRIVIFGASGMLGRYLHTYFKDRYGYKILSLDRTDFDLTKINQHDFDRKFNKDDVIINAAGVIKQRNYSLIDMIAVNSIFPHKLEYLKEKIGCKVIHITTDCVYTGITNIPYDELSIPNATDEYGKSKLLGEAKSLNIIRTSIIGEEIKNKKSLLEQVKINKDGEMFGYMNHFWNGITCLELAKLIEIIITTNGYWEGTRHFFSPEIISKHKLISMINDVYDLNIKIIPTYEAGYCYRALDSVFPGFNITTPILDQIKQLKNFKL